MITDNITNIVYFSSLLASDPKYKTTCKQITEILEFYNIKYAYLPFTKDIWARDFMPVQISQEKFLEYRYDPDYLQGKKYRKLKTHPDIVCEAINLKTIKTDIIIDGGNIVKSSGCVIMTDKVIEENKYSYKPHVIIEKLKVLFQVDKIVLIPWDINNEYFGHADGMIRFIDPTTVLLNGYFETYDEGFKQKLFGSLKQNKLNIEMIKFHVPKEDNLNWCYVNFLQMEDLLLLPKLGIEEDSQALEQIKGFFPEYAKRGRIFQIDVTPIIKGGGALNCISWNIKI